MIGTGIQKKVLEIIKKVAKANGISEEEALKIWKSQWSFLKEKLTKTEFGDKVETMKFPKWGKYYTSGKKLKYIKSYVERRNEQRPNQDKDRPDTETGTTREDNSD